jgi:hypothetical protein
VVAERPPRSYPGSEEDFLEGSEPHPAEPLGRVFIIFNANLTQPASLFYRQSLANM